MAGGKYEGLRWAKEIGRTETGDGVRKQKDGDHEFERWTWDIG